MLNDVKPIVPKGISALIHHRHVNPEARERERKRGLEAAEIECLANVCADLAKQQRVLDELLGYDDRWTAAAQRRGARDGQTVPESPDHPVPK